jgi:hypothetical protein
MPITNLSLYLLAITPADQQSGRLPAAENKRQLAAQKNSLAMPIFEEDWRFYGEDLRAVLGTLISEPGTGSQIKSAFRTAKSFASWLGLCPDNRVNGGKMLKAKTPKVVSRVAADKGEAFKQTPITQARRHPQPPKASQ